MHNTTHQVERQRLYIHRYIFPYIRFGFIAAPMHSIIDANANNQFVVYYGNGNVKMLWRATAQKSSDAF